MIFRGHGAKTRGFLYFIGFLWIFMGNFASVEKLYLFNLRKRSPLRGDVAKRVAEAGRGSKDRQDVSCPSEFKTPLASCAAAASRVKHGLPYAAERLRPGAMDGKVSAEASTESAGDCAPADSREPAFILSLKEEDSC
ncbi:MAG: hypothetical protein LBF80_04130 [Spirochaetaceae bacterium]|jgi:hypothetical protein|nr:hypothetical protein [Spirochaetaceae bacterium]